MGLSPILIHPLQPTPPYLPSTQPGQLYVAQVAWGLDVATLSQHMSMRKLSQILRRHKHGLQHISHTPGPAQGKDQVKIALYSIHRRCWKTKMDLGDFVQIGIALFSVGDP